MSQNKHSINASLLNCSQLPDAVDFALSVLTGLNEDERKTYGRGLRTPEEVATLVSGVVAYRLKNDFKLPEFNSEAARDILAQTFYSLTGIYVSLFSRLTLVCEKSLAYLNEGGRQEHTHAELLLLKTMGQLTTGLSVPVATFKDATADVFNPINGYENGLDPAQFEMLIQKSSRDFEKLCHEKLGANLADKWLNASNSVSCFTSIAAQKLKPMVPVIQCILAEFNARIEKVDQHQSPSLLELVEEAHMLYASLCLAREGLLFTDFPKSDGSGYYIDSFEQSQSRLPLNLFFGNSHAQRIALRNSIAGTWTKGAVPYQSFSQAFYEAHNCDLSKFFDLHNSSPKTQRVLWRPTPGEQPSLF